MRTLVFGLVGLVIACRSATETKVAPEASPSTAPGVPAEAGGSSGDVGAPAEAGSVARINGFTLEPNVCEKDDDCAVVTDLGCGECCPAEPQAIPVKARDRIVADCAKRGAPPCFSDIEKYRREHCSKTPPESPKLFRAQCIDHVCVRARVG